MPRVRIRPKVGLKVLESYYCFIMVKVRIRPKVGLKGSEGVGSTIGFSVRIRPKVGLKAWSPQRGGTPPRASESDLR